MKNRFLWFLVAIVIGAAGGLAYGWVIHPLRPPAVMPSKLLPEYQADYVLMVAEVYQSEGSVPKAVQRLAGLGNESPARLTQQAILTARQLNYSNADVDTLAKLSQALLTWTAQQTGATP